MPLARILTRNPERTADLSTQLKQQGYSVEVARPDQTNLAPADLEIEFEVCERADVLDRAADLASELGADVAVAPGVLQMPPKPAAEPIMYGSTAPQPLPPETVASEPVLSQKIVSQEVLSQKIVAEPEPETVRLSGSHPAIEHGQRDPEREFEAAFAPVIEMPAAAQASQEVVEVPVMESEPMPPVAFLEESPAAEPIGASPIAERHTEEHTAAPIIFPEPPRAADPMPYLAQLTPFSGRTNRTDADRARENRTLLQRFVGEIIRKFLSVAKKFCRMAQESRHRPGQARWRWRLPPGLLFAIILRNTGSVHRCAPLKPGLSTPPACLTWNSAVLKRIRERRNWNSRGNRQPPG